MTNPYGSKWIRPDKRLAIYLRDRFTCLVCLRDMHGANHRDLTLDHLNPRASDFGTNESSNLYTSCLNCNSRRQDNRLSDIADEAAIKRIWNNVALDITPYRELAKTLTTAQKNMDTAAQNASARNAGQAPQAPQQPAQQVQRQPATPPTPQQPQR